MANGTEIAKAYVQVIPSMDGISGNLASAFGGTGAAKGLGLSMGDGFAMSFGQAAFNGLVKVGTEVIDFGKDAVNAGKNFDVAMSQVSATMADKAEEAIMYNGKEMKSIEALRLYAQEMGATTQFSASQSAEALNYMALAGYDAETAIGMLPNVLNLAAAGSIDLAYASDMITDASSALGLSIPETTDLVDIMAVTASSSNTSVEQLGEAFLTVGPTAREASGGVEELSTVLGVLGNSGIKGSEAGTHLRNILLQMNPTTEAAAKAWESLGVSAYDAQGNLRPLNETFEDLTYQLSAMSSQERTAILTDMFNKTDLASINTLLSATIGNADEVADAFEEAGLKFEDFLDEEEGTNALSMAMTEAFFALKDGSLSSAEGIEQFTKSLSYFGLTTEQADQFMETFLSTANASDTEFNKLAENVSNFDGAAERMRKTMTDNLAGDIDQFKSAMEGFQIALSDQVTPSLREFVQFGAEGISSLTTAFQEGGISQAMEEFGNILADGLTGLVEIVTSDEFINAGMQIIGSIGQGIIDNLPLIATTALQIALKLITTLISAAPQLIQSAIVLISQLAQDLASQLPTLIPTMVDAVITMVMALIDNIDMLIDSAIILIEALANGLIDAMPILIEKAPEIIGKLVAAIVMELPQLISLALELIIGFAGGIIDALPELLLIAPTIIKEFVKALADGIVDFEDTGAHLVEGLWNGISGKVDWIIAKIKTFGADVLQGMKDFFAVASPSKLMRDEVGRYIAEGVGVGIEEYADEAVESAIDMSEDVMGAFDGLNGEMNNALESNMSLNSSSTLDVTSTDTNNMLMDLLNQYLPMIANKDLKVSLEGDADSMFSVMQKQSEIYRNQNGKSAFA